MFAIPHMAYRRLAPADFPQPRLIVDANNVIGDDLAATRHSAGSRLLGVGKGHWRRLGHQS